MIPPCRLHTTVAILEQARTAAAGGTRFERATRDVRIVHFNSVFGVLVFAGCGTFVDFTPLNHPPHELHARAASSVGIFSSGPPRGRAYVDVAVVEAEQTHGLNQQGTALMIQRLREQAAAIGCDAIVLGGTSQRSGATPGSGWDLLDPGSTTRQATCIVYDDEPPPSPFWRAKQATRAAPSEADERRIPQRRDNEDPGHQ